MRKCTVFLLITCLVVSSLIVHAVTPVSAQAGYKPSVPQFTVEPIFIGELVDTIIVSIKNQPFTPYKDANGYDHKLYYRVQIRLKGEQSWRPLFGYFQSDSQYTTMGLAKYGVLDLGLNSLPAVSQLDFRAIAEIRYSESSVPIAESGWSDVHTITLRGETATSSPPSQTVTLPPVISDGNSQPQPPYQTQTPNCGIFSNPLFTLVVGALFAGIVIAVVMVLRRHIKTSTYINVSSQTNTSDEV